MKRWLWAFGLIALVLCTSGAYAFRLSGTIEGGQGGLHLAGVIAVPTGLDTFYVTIGLPFVNTYTFSDLDSGGYVLFAYQDLNNNLTPDLDEPRGFYGGQLPTIFSLESDSSGVVIEIAAPNTGGFSGRISYAGAQTGTTIIESFYTPNFDTDLPHGGIVLFNNTGNGTYTAVVDSFTTYYVMAFMDVNGNFAHDAEEPFGVYGGTTPQSITVQPTNFPDSINIVMDDPSATPERPTAGERNFRLDAVYPNPFNSQARVSFELPTASPITLSVFDGLGREVQILAGGMYPAGTTSLTFSAGDLPSGQYYLRLRTNSGSAVQKALLLR
jgi:hypothetical protein